MFKKLEKVIGPLADKLGTNKVLISIRDGFLIVTPLIIVASLFLVIGNFPVPGYAELMAKIFGEGWDAALNPIIRTTFGMIALLSTIGIGYSYARQLEVDAIAGAVLSVVSFLMLAPTNHGDFRGLALDNLGSKGIFLAMISSLIAVKIFAAIKKKGWVIKMPDGVPPAVSSSFAALIPSSIAMFFFLVVSIIFSKTSYGYAHNFIYKVLQAPLVGLGGSVLFLPIYQFLSTLFWFFGINGPAVTNTVFGPILDILTIENLEAFRSGQVLPHIFTGPFSDFFGNFGGGGSTLSLVLLMLFMAKSERMKKLGGLSILPGIFGINEMVIFGLPIVLNPVMLIPFLTVPVMNTVLATIVTKIGIIPYTLGIKLPWTTPIFFSGWLSTGSILAGFFQILLLLLGCLVYYPFFKVLDNKFYETEQGKGEDKEKDDLEDMSLDDISFD